MDYLSGPRAEGTSSGTTSASSIPYAEPLKYQTPNYTPIYLTGSALDLGMANSGYLPYMPYASGFAFGVIPSTNAATLFGLPGEEVPAIGNMAQDQGPNDGVSRSAVPSPTANLVVLAAAGRDPADIIIPTQGSEGTGTGSSSGSGSGGAGSGGGGGHGDVVAANGSGSAAASGSGILVSQGAISLPGGSSSGSAGPVTASPAGASDAASAGATSGPMSGSTSIAASGAATASSSSASSGTNGASGAADTVSTSAPIGSSTTAVSTAADSSTQSATGRDDVEPADDPPPAQGSNLVPAGSSPPQEEGYWAGVGKVLIGEGKAVVNTVVGVGSAIAHPIRTVQGLAYFAVNPAITGAAVGKAVRSKLESGLEGQGEVAGDVLLIVAPIAATKVLRAAKTAAELAEGGEVASGLAEGAAGGAKLAEGAQAGEGAIAAGESATPLAEGAAPAGELAGEAAKSASSAQARFIVDSKGVVIDTLAPSSGSVRGMDPNAVRFSQRSAGGSGRAAPLRESMKGGWNGPAVDAVETADGVVTIDNTRVAIARELGMEEIPVNVHLPSDPLPESMLGRFGDAKTWGEALAQRTGKQRPPLPFSGTPDTPRLPQ